VSPRRALAEVVFGPAQVESGPGAVLLDAMRAEIAELYDGLDLDADFMPRGGAAELGAPGGAFLIGWHDGAPVCCGGLKRLQDGICELKRMYVVPAFRGRGVARQTLRALEAEARRLGYERARLDTGPKQLSARGLYVAEGYAAVDDFNGNPIAAFWGEKPLSECRGSAVRGC
jgi:GNAT superfamily N-acetyltransferase